MDIDVDTLDLNNDPIKAFINFKLEEIRARNNELSNQLQKKKKMLDKYVNQTHFDKSTTYKFKEKWKKIIGNYIVVGFSSKQTLEVTEDIKVIIQWDEEKPINYTVKTFTYYVPSIPESKLISKEIENVIKVLKSGTSKNGTSLSSEWIESTTNFSEITAVINIPDFSSKQNYNFEGIVVMKTNDNEIQIALPSFQITVGDLYNADILISENDILEYKKESVLSFLSLNPKVELILYIEETNTNRNLKEILLGCMRKVTCSDNLYIPRNICNSSLGPIVKIHEIIEEGVYLIHVFYGVQTSVEILIHFLFLNIPFLTVIPKTIDFELFKQFGDGLKLLLSKPVHKILLQKLGKCLELEMELLETVLLGNITGRELEHKTEGRNSNVEDIINFSMNKEDYFKLRRQLLPLENHSTIIYRIINNKINSSKNK
ncbi:uncharacterized protein LOC108735020 [Agrilus planipennis]|uniref:Uncharacterized protein LOC108735020 n=1 Tax=Agrilus planipennis TaxID=224129 RepID=A0A1W4WQJ6_AGRPL|nr:uncharacterized protein LOC108735020 [Agrilus planipennis]